MIIKLSDNIISPIGFNSIDNFNALRKGVSALRLYDSLWNLPEPFIASLLDYRAIADAFSKIGDISLYTHFEQIAILSAYNAIANANIDSASNDVQFIISTTKGNVELLESETTYDKVLLGYSAKKIARFFNNNNNPLVVSNACISGVTAQIAAMRILQSGRMKYTVVIGADCISKFIVSGFQSFKALSDEPCKPYDANRKGLNLGEAAATIILTKTDNADSNTWTLSAGAIRNDANHISGPSRTGEGSYRALRAILNGVDINDIAFINAHGTATLYNDEMEAIAIHRAGLSDVPLNTLKGYYGHTLGTAGILESIISMQAADNGIVLANRGYDTCGVTCKVNISSNEQETSGNAFIKLLSGFGGCNAALLFKKGV